VLTSTLNKLRNNAIKLSSDYISTPAETLHTDVNHLCLRKGPDGTQIVFCVTNKSSSGDSYEMTVGGFQPNQNVVEVLSCKTSTANGVGTLTMYMGKGEPKVYVPAAALKDTGICGTTTADGPVSGAAAVRGTGGALLAALVVGWGIMVLA
jgi:alpha-amylase